MQHLVDASLGIKAPALQTQMHKRDRFAQSFELALHPAEASSCQTSTIQASFRPLALTCYDRPLRDKKESICTAGQPDQTFGAHQMAEVFQNVLDTMDVQMAEVVRWRLFENLTFKEIALRQGVPLNTALGRMHRGLNQIRKALAHHQFIDERSTE